MLSLAAILRILSLPGRVCVQALAAGHGVQRSRVPLTAPPPPGRLSPRQSAPHTSIRTDTTKPDSCHLPAGVIRWSNPRENKEEQSAPGRLLRGWGTPTPSLHFAKCQNSGPPRTGASPADHKYRGTPQGDRSPGASPPGRFSFSGTKPALPSGGTLLLLGLWGELRQAMPGESRVLGGLRSPPAPLRLAPGSPCRHRPLRLSGAHPGLLPPGGAPAKRGAPGQPPPGVPSPAPGTDGGFGGCAKASPRPFPELRTGGQGPKGIGRAAGDGVYLQPP